MVSEMELRMNDMLAANPEMLARIQLQRKNEQRLNDIQECVDTLNGILCDIEYAQGLCEDLGIDSTIRTYAYLDEAYNAVNKVWQEVEGFRVWEENRLAPRQTCNRKPVKKTTKRKAKPASKRTKPRKR